MTAASDFVQVQLSASGVALGASVRINNGHFSYTFAVGKPVRVLTSEWARVLSLKTFKGAQIFELAPGAAAPTSTRTISPAASHTDAPATQAQVQTQAKPATASAAPAAVESEVK
jgi:hypothetical protein